MSSAAWPRPRVIDDGGKQGYLDAAAQDVVAPLADRANDDRDGIHDAERDVGDSVDSRA